MILTITKSEFASEEDFRDAAMKLFKLFDDRGNKVGVNNTEKVVTLNILPLPQDTNYPESS